MKPLWQNEPPENRIGAGDGRDLSASKADQQTILYEKLNPEMVATAESLRRSRGHNGVREEVLIPSGHEKEIMLTGRLSLLSFRLA
jgi:hypothetical protein